MNGFFVGNWQHAMPARAKDSNGRTDIIVRLCFGPLETEIYGISDNGKFFYEYHQIEGVQAGTRDFEYISGTLFFKELDYEIALSQKNNDLNRRDALELIKQELIIKYGHDS